MRDMKRSAATLIAMVLMVALMMTGTAHAADATLGVDAMSAYVWRGITFNDGLVFQPSIDVSSKGFGVNVWGNIDADDYNNTLDTGEFSEVDLTLSYGIDIKSLSLGIGYIEYLFPAGGKATREVYGSIGYELVKGLSIGTDLYYDFGEVDDYYFSFNIGYEYEIISNLTISAAAAAGYAGEDMALGGQKGWNDYKTSLSLSYTVMEALTISGTIAYTDSLDKDVLPEQDTNTYGGIGLYLAF